jgi:hypothetical protein
VNTVTNYERPLRKVKKRKEKKAQITSTYSKYRTKVPSTMANSSKTSQVTTAVPWQSQVKQDK